MQVLTEWPELCAGGQPSFNPTIGLALSIASATRSDRNQAAIPPHYDKCDPVIAFKVKDPFSALLHLLGVALSIVGLVVLLVASGDSARAVVVSAVYGTCLLLLYLASTLLHAIPCSGSMARRFEQFDNAAIFLLIAGTYTPVSLLIIRGKLGLVMLIVEWLLAAKGIYNVFWGPAATRRSMVATCLFMGWLFFFALGPLLSNIPATFLPWLIGGALFYSIGTILYLVNWPPLWKGCFSGHDCWHASVLAGSACHYVLILHFVMLSGG